MSEAPISARTFRYEKPTTEATKQIVRLARTDRMFVGVQVVRTGAIRTWRWASSDPWRAS